LSYSLTSDDGRRVDVMKRTYSKEDFIWILEYSFLLTGGWYLEFTICTVC